MDYHCIHYITSHGTEARISAICAAGDFYSYVISTRTDGMEDLHLYCDSQAEAERMERALESLHCDTDSNSNSSSNNGIELTQRYCVSAAALLAKHDPCAPIDVTERVRIYPDDPDHPENAIDEQRSAQNDVRLYIPPGAAFGDGHHPSTQMAARLLDTCDCTGKRVLDMGSGTGVLGLIAHKRGAAVVDFSDICPDSVRFTRETCARNGYPQAHTFVSDLLEHCPHDQPYDIILANIYADLLWTFFDDPALDAILPTGQCILSGISYKRIDEIQRIVGEKGFTIEQHINQEWWHAMLVTRSS